MAEKSFGNWLKHRLDEYANYGFEELNKDKDPKKLDEELPLHPLKIEYITQLLRKKAYGTKYPVLEFQDLVQWGNDDGALQVKFSPLGGVRAVVRKLIHNLRGEKVWVCKKVIEVKNYYDEHPDKLHYLLDETLTEVDGSALDAPAQGYKDLERLALQLASTLRRKTTQKIFMYEGIRVVKEDKEYIIHFGVTGMGRQRKDQKRLDQFAVFLKYDEEAGIIKIAGNDLGDKLDRYNWQYDPSEFVEHFTPNQKVEDIVNAILVNFNCY